jgi:hypothetical protein
MQQHYMLGKYLRKRYSKLLSKRYSVQEIYVRSSDKNRALQSAASNLAGLYPPSKDQIWNEDLLWQPVPVHAVPTDDDNLLVVDNPCPTYDTVFLNQTKPIIDAYNQQYADFFAYIRNQSGLKKLDFWDIGDIYDPLYCESAHGLKLPSWTQSIVNKTTGQTVYELIVDLKTIAKNLKYNSDEKAKLTGGFLLGDILERMKNIVASANGKNTTRGKKNEGPTKMVMYSAHDDTLMALLYAMNVIQRPFLVPYASTVIIDLYQTKDGNTYVEAQYKNNTPNVECGSKKQFSKCEKSDSSEDSSEMESSNEKKSSMIQFTIPGCPGFQCPLDTFLSSLDNRTSYPASKRRSDCGIKQAQSLLRKSVIFDRL